MFPILRKSRAVRDLMVYSLDIFFFLSEIAYFLLTIFLILVCNMVGRTFVGMDAFDLSGKSTEAYDA